MRKIVLIIFVLAVGVLTAFQVSAGEDLWDWVWSDSVGWVRFKYDDTNAHYKLVDGNTAEYVLNNTGGWQYDAYRVTDPPLGAAGNITSVNIRARFKGDIDLGLRLNGIESDIGTNIYVNIAGGWAWANGGGGQSFISLRPGGGIWTWNDIENLQVVVGLKKDGAIQAQAYLVEIVVNGTTLPMNNTGDYTNISDSIPAGVPASRFGYLVEVNRTTGVLSGYAWSENIGWISFEPTSVSGCPTAPCQAYIDFPTAKVYGWARACSVFSSGCSGALTSNRGNWDGWIRFNGALYSAQLNDTPNPSEFFNWAWGDNYVIGWLSLNRINTGGPIDYKVKTNLKLNAPPVAAFNCNPVSCQVYMGQILVLDNVSSDPDGNNQIDLCQWYWDDLTDAAGYSLFQSCVPPPSPYLCDATFGSTRGRWNVKLRVEDSKGAFDEEIKEVRVLRDIVASFQCSLDGSTWSACSTISPVEGDIVYLKDTSDASEISFGTSSVINSWTWLVNGSNVGTASKIQANAEVPSMTIKLTVRDSNNHQAEVTQTLLGIMPLPTWKEIAPF